MSENNLYHPSEKAKKVSLINDLPESFKGLATVFFLLPNIM